MKPELLELNQQRKKYGTPMVLPLSEMTWDEHTCTSGSGDIGCGTGSSASFDCTTNGAAAQVARPHSQKSDN